MAWPAWLPRGPGKRGRTAERFKSTPAIGSGWTGGGQTPCSVAGYRQAYGIVLDTEGICCLVREKREEGRAGDTA